VAEDSLQLLQRAAPHHEPGREVAPAVEQAEVVEPVSAVAFSKAVFVRELEQLPERRQGPVDRRRGVGLAGLGQTAREPIGLPRADLRDGDVGQRGRPRLPFLLAAEQPGG
jgi:hypothetical protein